jgi:circadian clock protein KaiB
MPRRVPDAKGAMEALLARPDTGRRYVLRLYVSGRKPRSAGAIATLTALCLQHLEGRYDLEVIDVDENPKLAIREQILALPTLVRELPAPLRRFVGDLADPERVLVGLDLAPRRAS